MRLGLDPGAAPRGAARPAGVGAGAGAGRARAADPRPTPPAAVRAALGSRCTTNPPPPPSAPSAPCSPACAAAATCRSAATPSSDGGRHPPAVRPRTGRRHPRPRRGDGRHPRGRRAGGPRPAARRDLTPLQGDRMSHDTTTTTTITTRSSCPAPASSARAACAAPRSCARPSPRPGCTPTCSARRTSCCRARGQREEIGAMPGIRRESPDLLLKTVESDLKLGLRHVLLFGLPEDEVARRRQRAGPRRPGAHRGARAQAAVRRRPAGLLRHLPVRLHRPRPLRPARRRLRRQRQLPRPARRHGQRLRRRRAPTSSPRPT